MRAHRCLVYTSRCVEETEAWEWLKRVWLAWVIINGIGAFIAYVRPLFDGLATLE